VTCSFERILPAFGSILPFPEKETVVMKCKTCAHKVNAKSKFGIYIFIVETGACKVVCDNPLDLCVIYERGRRGRDVVKEAVGEEADP
jgi:hypothetical protein